MLNASRRGLQELIPAFDPKRSRVLISKKRNDTRARDAQLACMKWLETRGIHYQLDVHDPDTPNFQKPAPSTRPDLVITLGGDGTVLRTVDSLVSDDSCGDPGSPAPAILAFAVGSLGFLTPHSFGNFDQILKSLFSEPSPVTMRCMLSCQVRDTSGECLTQHRVLNECLVARGSRSSFHRLDVAVNGRFLAQFQADGLIVATPSGSSAYSLAAGGSLVAPTVPAILLTPVAPHSLSTRPLILPADAELEISVPQSSRTAPIASFDGQNDRELKKGQVVKISAAKTAVPFITGEAPLSDWFGSLRSKLHWAKELRE